jgi:hypothetical protein
MSFTRTIRIAGKTIRAAIVRYAPSTASSKLAGMPTRQRVALTGRLRGADIGAIANPEDAAAAGAVPRPRVAWADVC